MKNTKLVITLIAGALTLTQAGYAAQEAVQPEVQAQAQPTEQATLDATTPELTPEQLQTIEKAKTLVSVLNPKILIFEQKAKDLLDTINKIEPGKDIPADKVKEYFQGLKAEVQQYLVDNILSDFEALHLLSDLPRPIQDELTELIFMNKFFNATKYLERAVLAAQWKAEEALGIDKNLIFGNSIFYAARTQPTRIPLGKNFSIRLRRHCSGFCGDSLSTPVVSSETIEAISDSYINQENDMDLDGVGGTRIFNFKAIKKGYATVFIPEGDFTQRSPEGYIILDTAMEYILPNAPVTGYFAQFIVEEPQAATPEQAVESKEAAPAFEQATSDTE